MVSRFVPVGKPPGKAHALHGNSGAQVTPMALWFAEHRSMSAASQVIQVLVVKQSSLRSIIFHYTSHTRTLHTFTVTNAILKFMPFHFGSTLWLFNVALENGPFIDDLWVIYLFRMMIFHGQTLSNKLVRRWSTCVISNSGAWEEANIEPTHPSYPMIMWLPSGKHTIYNAETHHL